MVAQLALAAWNVYAGRSRADEFRKWQERQSKLEATLKRTQQMAAQAKEACENPASVRSIAYRTKQ